MLLQWRMLLALAAAEILAMSLWFSASAVVPQLTLEWGLGPGAQSWLTMSVQLGFVVGALASAVLNLSDRVPAQRVFEVSAYVGAAANAAIALVPLPLGVVLGLRFVTGAALAGVYPPAMKLAVSWFAGRRGVAVGTLVAATTVGSALPHLFSALPVFAGPAGLPPWPAVLLTASASAVLGGLIARAVIRPGPDLPVAAPFDWRQAVEVLRDRPTRKANFGYFGHMFELYAMWAWVPLFLLGSYRQAGLGEAAARVAGFGVIAIGGLGCVLAGILADRVGRTTVTTASLVASGACALVAGHLGHRPLLLTAICLLWGFAVVADSAQFSAAVSELCHPSYVGTALAMQTALGFLLTTLTIRLTPTLAAGAGWGVAFGLLALGPVFGIYHMQSLRRLPEAERMAGGRR